MADEVVLSGAKFAVNELDLSAYVTDITLNYGSESQDVSTMGTGTRKHKGSVLDWSIDVTMMYDQSTSGPEARLWALEGVTACVEYRVVNECSTASNPEYSGIATIFNGPIGGAWGGMLKFTTKAASYGTLSRASSSA